MNNQRGWVLPGLIGVLLFALLVSGLLHAGTRTNIGGMSVTDGTIVVGGLPAGGIIMWGKTAIPSGWLLCDGTAYASSTYPVLYAAIGTTYNRGGEAAGYFRVPDGRGLFPIGAGTSGVYGSNYTGTLGGYGQDSDQSHSHSHTHSTGGTDAYAGGIHVSDFIGGSQYNGVLILRYQTTDISGRLAPLTYSCSTDSTANSGRTGNVTKPGSFGVNYIMKY